MIDPRTPILVGCGQITDFVGMNRRCWPTCSTKEQLGRKVSVSEKDGRTVFHPIQA